MPDADPAPVETLLDEFVARLRRGESPSISAYEARYPSKALQIRQLFAAAQAVEQMAERRRRDRGPEQPSSKPVERLGDFRLIREIGRGGMGVVYEAEQESLGRRVAVKLLPDSALINPRALRRFEREARTAARLHHTNIIPVFGVGTYQGLHYIVMQLIRGVGLDTILRQLARDFASDVSPSPTNSGASGEFNAVAHALVRGEFSRARPPSDASRPSTSGEATLGSDAASSEATPPPADPRPADEYVPGPLGAGYWASVARVGVQSARALEYAHQQGTLHRDVKPANLLLDAQGVVWLGDFGLARAREQSRVSETGEIAGTLRYMAPEQFHGQVDARSDVYSLGLTLYEMLTLRPAFEDARPAVLMRRITEDPPPRPRSVNPRIPADLETIVLKAIAREPADRYRSAQELGDDLERVLDDRPIQARHVGAVERLWRWSRRNRTVASLSVLIVALLVQIAFISSVGYLRLRLANRTIFNTLVSESHQRQVAESERRKAEELAGLTSAALDDIFEEFVPSTLTGGIGAPADGPLDREVRAPVQPVLSKDIAALLERMLRVYEHMAEQEGDDREILRKVADANRRVGDIRRRLGHLDQAETAYRRSIDTYRRLDGSPHGPALSVEVARILNEIGGLHWSARSEQEGAPQHREAMEVLKAGGVDAESPPQGRYELARTLYFLGRGGPPEAVPGQESEEGDPQLPEDRGQGSGSPQPYPTRRANLEQAIRILENLVADEPTVPAYRHLLACCYRDLPLERRDARPESDADSQARAIAILRKLAADFPEVPDYRYDLSKAYTTVDPREPRFAGAGISVVEGRLREAIKLLEGLVAEHPNVPDYAASHVQALYLLSEVIRRTDSPDEAEPLLRQALAEQASLVTRFPGAWPYWAWRAILQDTLAKLLSESGRTTEARALLESAVASLNHVLSSGKQAGYVHSILGRCYKNLAEVLSQTGEEDRAAEMLRLGREHRPD
ncbi:MAG: serine/threonine-protein kinase [Isosphaeraceae bacterium]